MAIYRGAGGASDSVDDATVNAVAAYAADAASSATAAAASAVTANDAASSTSGSVAAVATSATNAATSASNASISASNASVSASSADASATSATASALAASVSAFESAASALGADTSEANSAASAASASTFADNSAASAASALAIYGNTTAMNNAVSAAATSASNAATSASNAATSAITATTQSANASDSAIAADSSELSALVYANNAAVSAYNANVSATNSASVYGGLSAVNTAVATTTTNANNAATSATNAATSATQAAASAASASAIVLGTASSLPSIRPTLNLDFANSDVIDPRITFTRASTATYYDSLGILQTAASGVARLDHDPVTFAAKGLLIEEARTNLLTYSSEFDNAVWTKVAAGTATAPVVSANVSASPAGSIDADLVVFNAGTNTGSDSSTLQGPTFSATAQAYTASIWLKTSDGSSKTVQLSISGAATAVITVTGVWQRFSTTWTATVGTWNLRVLVGLGLTSASASLYAWGAQVEAGAFATSYIPTTTAQATRAADSASMTGTNFSSWYNAGEGSFCSDFLPYIVTGNGGALSVNDGTANNRIDLRRDGFSLISSSGISQASMSVSGMTANVSNRLAMGYALNNFVLVRNGGTVTSDTLGTVPSGISLLQIGGLDNVSSFSINGTIRSIIYYPKRISNTELQALTA